ncbi:aKG-HExxH-type peptide beta-hydroxylase [Mycobacterium parmense]|uniref:Uncharacterized protein n=1 Tax=Mycobacterium parmense TaxID=185642 RepID=A0A7I7YX39_9MYCO|nr:HEXXH motif-containing putative peptide modification protein [Mycobacterium parmense]MCV7350003.1 hypothetical protein [Mycobacterium parmense]ORW59283.1 hypothetical protein AWC20_10070 [Mycobacterium parmense]BBZ46465.1 hypothetical protein MPRM_37460 [Mycobacterium parmense]
MLGERPAVEPEAFPASKVHLLPDALRWEDVSRGRFDPVFDDYVSLVGNTLHRALDDDRTPEDGFVGNLAAKLRSVPSPDFLRVALSPCFTSRLLWQPATSARGALEFLDRALHVEAVISGRERADCDAWTALGDVKVLRSGEILRGVGVPGLPPLDFDGPNITDDLPTGGADPARFGSLSGAVRPTVIDRITVAWEEITATSEAVADFVAKFVQVIVPRCDTARTRFSSGSYRQYIGRVVIGNPHAAGAGHVAHAEALVHEAIHALLYMALYPVSWGVRDPRAYRPGERVVSPWTGAHLQLSSYLQACFVWYGLVHFWDLARQGETFGDGDRARCRRDRALGGFVGPPLLDLLGSDNRALIRADVVDAVESIQDRVLSRFG